jgi:hypothetical protein
MSLGLIGFFMCFSYGASLAVCSVVAVTFLGIFNTRFFMSRVFISLLHNKSHGADRIENAVLLVLRARMLRTLSSNGFIRHIIILFQKRNILTTNETQNHTIHRNIETFVCPLLWKHSAFRSMLFC